MRRAGSELGVMIGVPKGRGVATGRDAPNFATLSARREARACEACFRFGLRKAFERADRERRAPKLGTPKLPGDARKAVRE